MANIAGFEFDSKISLGNIIIIVGMLTGGIVGYTKLENNVALNARVNQEQNEQIEELVVQMRSDKDFHIDQRVRLWERINVIQISSQEQKERFARMEATLEHTSRQLDRMLEKLEALQEK